MNDPKLILPDDDDDDFPSAQPYQPTTMPKKQLLVGGVPMEMNYVRSKQGLLKIVEIILSLIVAICAGTAEAKCYICGPAGYMMRVAIAAIIVSILLFVIFAFNLKEKITFIHWPGTEFLNCFIFTVTYFVGSCWLAANITHGDADTATVVFGFITVAVYAVSTWLSFVECRRIYRNRQNRSHAPNTVTTTTAVHVRQTY